MSTYLKFYELQKPAFDAGSSRGLVLGTRALRSAFEEIRAGLEDEAPRICLNGGPGMGKTSLARALPKLLGEQARVALLLDPTPAWPAIRSALVRQFELEGGVLSRRALARARAQGRRLVFVIDQAERVSREVLDHLDVLLRYRGDSDEQLLHCILLANLSAARDSDDHPLLWWLDSLNTLQLEYAPIPAAGIQSYIHRHLKRAGFRGEELFSDDAVRAIHRHTGGVPGAVSQLAERALTEAAERGCQRIEADLIEELGNEQIEATAEDTHPGAQPRSDADSQPMTRAPDAEQGAPASEQGERADDRARAEEDATSHAPALTALDHFFAGRPVASADESDADRATNTGTLAPLQAAEAEASPPEFWPPEADTEAGGGRSRMGVLLAGIVCVALVVAGAALLRRSDTRHSAEPSRHVARAKAPASASASRPRSVAGNETPKPARKPAPKSGVERSEANETRPPATRKRVADSTSAEERIAKNTRSEKPAAASSPTSEAGADRALQTPTTNPAPTPPAAPAREDQTTAGALPAAPADAMPPGAQSDERYW